jgi:CHASE2 domain-containing sensor protein
MGEGEGSKVGEILVGAARFILLSVSLLVFQRLISKTSPVESIKNSAYSLLQVRLASAADPSQDIVVVDIHGFPKTPRADLERADSPTSRTALFNLLSTLTEEGATTIGVDVDFSPEDDGNYVLPDDPTFFSRVEALSRRTHTPIFLGVWRQSAQGSDNWLADPQFANLAAGLPIPNENTRYMPLYVQAGKGETPLQTMAARLASTQATLRDQPPKWTLGLLQSRFAALPAPGLKIETIAVDFSQIENFVRNRIAWQEALRPNSLSRVKGRIVLVGNGSPSSVNDSGDLFSVPGRSRRFAGIFLHASATYSALEAPLFEFRDGGDEQLDLIVGAVLLSLIAGFKIWLRKDPDFHLKASQYTLRLYLGTAAVLLIFGVWFVNVTRTMWEDFPIFIAVLLLHHWTESFVEKHLEKKHSDDTKPLPVAEPEVFDSSYGDADFEPRPHPDSCSDPDSGPGSDAGAVQK